MRRVAVTAVSLLLLVTGAARADRSRMPVVMIVEVVALNAAIACGASARVITVERGTWSGETIALRWRACSSPQEQGITLGTRLRVQVNRRGHDSERRYVVHRSELSP